MTQKSGFELLLNPRVQRERAYPESLREIICHRQHARAAAEIQRWPGYAPTPLRSLAGAAAALGIGELLYKDEGERFGLGSFKALGAPYGALRAIERRLRDRGVSEPIDSRGLRPPAKAIVARVTLACATDGNHGRALAWGARLLGCRSVVYLPGDVSPGREQAIRAEGARTVRVEGTYDEAVSRVDEDARRNGWVLVSDQAYSGYETVPRDVMQGYTLILAEIASSLAGAPPTHLVVPAGVGGLAAALCAHGWELWGRSRPVLAVVEPDAAACLFRSAAAGEPTVAPGPLHTVMACLSCGEVSTLGWKILRVGADAFVTIADELAIAGMRDLAAGIGGDAPVVAGESGVAAFAALRALALDRGARRKLGLGATSRAVVIGSEAATDPEIFARLVGTRADEITASRAQGGRTKG